MVYFSLEILFLKTYGIRQPKFSIFALLIIKNNLAKNKKYKSKWKYYYWIMVVSIFVALIFMVRFVLNSSKVFVSKDIAILPMQVEWGLERDGSLRINEPYFLNTDCELILEESDITSDSIQSFISSKPDQKSTLKDMEKPYLLWKHAESDTIHVLKNNVLFHFKLGEN